MAININSQPVQEVTAAEALQGGNPADKKASPKELKKVSDFIKAHQLKQTSTLVNNDQPLEFVENKGVVQDGPQVDANEQATATASKGFETSKKSSTKTETRKLIQVYNLLFSQDEEFLDRDLSSWKNFFTRKSQPLVDLATTLSIQDKALRKYLLTSLLLSDAENKNISNELNNTLKTILANHGDYITSTLEAFGQGRLGKLNDVTLREYIKAYQIMETTIPDEAPDIFNFFKAIRKEIGLNNFQAAMRRMLKEYSRLIVREKDTGSKRASVRRQHILLSRIQQLRILLAVYIVHEAFMKCCEKANLKNLPVLGALMEACLQAITTSEILAGVNTLIRFAASVKTSGDHGPNQFIAAYQKMVLQYELVLKLFPDASQQRQVNDHLKRNTKKNAVLGATGNRSNG